MRNKQLDDLLASIAYDRGHSAGQDEVNSIHNSLRSEFKEIDNMLPRTMPPQFKKGDWAIYAGERAYIDRSHVDANGDITYDINIPSWDGDWCAVDEDMLSPEK